MCYVPHVLRQRFFRYELWTGLGFGVYSLKLRLGEPKVACRSIYRGFRGSFGENIIILVQGSFGYLSL